MSVWQQVFSTGILFVILLKVTPILFAAIGGAFTQQADILNIGLEGMLLAGAFSAIVVGGATGSWVLGVLAAVASALLLSLVYAACTLLLKADYIVVGIGVNILAAGLTVFLLQVLYGNPGSTPPDVTISMPAVSLGFVGEIPMLGEALDKQTPLVWLALLSVPLFSFVLYRTRFGVHLRSVGEDLPAATAAGINGRRMKFSAILLTGLFCGLGGAQLSMATLGTFTANMTAGRGFIAVAALTFGRARPLPTLLAALIFGTADAVADRLGIAGVNSNLALMMPYVITILALTVAALDIRKRMRQRSNRSLQEV